MKVRGRSSGPTPEWAAGGVMLLETFEDRHDKGSLVITSQAPLIDGTT